MLDVAIHWSRGVSPYDKTLFQPFKEKFDDIEQSEIEELDVLMVEKKAKLNCLNIDRSGSVIVINNYSLTRGNYCYCCTI